MEKPERLAKEEWAVISGDVCERCQNLQQMNRIYYPAKMMWLLVSEVLMILSSSV